MGEMVQFPFAGGTTGGYLAVPEQGSGPGVIVIQEWWGLVDHIKDVCDRFAAEGFVALAPDMYHGKSTKSPDEAGKLMMAMRISLNTLSKTQGRLEDNRRAMGVQQLVLRQLGGVMPVMGECGRGYGLTPAHIRAGNTGRFSADLLQDLVTARIR